MHVPYLYIIGLLSTKVRIYKNFEKWSLEIWGEKAVRRAKLGA